MSFNKVVLMGNLTRDPDLRNTTTGGTPVVNCGIAVNRDVKRGEVWEKVPTFIEFSIWGKKGEAFARHHKKGDQAFVSGYLSMNEWKDKNTGEKRTALKVTADEWEFVGGRRESARGDDPDRGSSNSAADDTPF